MDLFNQVLHDLQNTGYLEIIAVITGIGSVWFARRESILVYPIGIVSVLLYVYLCFNAQLFAEAGVNVFYFFMSVYGWYHWTHKNGKVITREISVNTTKEQILGVVVTVAAFFIIFGLVWWFKKDNVAYMNSYVPYVDSLATAIFVVGMWLMALKRVENWIYWIVGDLISIPLYISKGLVLTSVQFTVFLVIAMLGYLEWRKRWYQRNLSV